MKCLFKNIECKHAGELTTIGCKEFGEEEGIHKHGVCYNNEIDRDITRCDKEE